jgi:hypothetical protein
MEWIPLEDFNFNNKDLVLINVDTRDFHVIGATETDVTVIEYPTRVVSIEKIKESLVRFKETSGGEREWRHFDICDTPYSNRWDFKYLRFRKSSEGWLFINDDKWNKNPKDAAYPPEFLDKEGVDWTKWYYENVYTERENPQEFKPYEGPIASTDSFTYWNNIPSKRQYPKPSQYRRETPKIQNNDPCSCGSGKKFKRCCK